MQSKLQQDIVEARLRDRKFAQQAPAQRRGAKNQRHQEPAWKYNWAIIMATAPPWRASVVATLPGKGETNLRGSRLPKNHVRCYPEMCIPDSGKSLRGLFHTSTLKKNTGAAKEKGAQHTLPSSGKSVPRTKATASACGARNGNMSSRAPNSHLCSIAATHWLTAGRPVLKSQSSERSINMTPRSAEA